jgi:hypothetical protein
MLAIAAKEVGTRLWFFSWMNLSMTNPSNVVVDSS